MIVPNILIIFISNLNFGNMKAILLTCITFLAINFSIGATHIINWTAGSHITTEIEVGDTVQWNFSGFHDVTSSGSPSFASSLTQSGGSYSITFNSVGEYYYFCSVHGLVSMDGTIDVKPILGVEEVESKSSFSIYPNPSRDVLNLKLPSNSSSVLVEIFDVTGKYIYKSTAIKPTTINIVNWKTGLYFVKVSSDNYKVTKRFIKE
ncbi:MAG: hypothetical protein COA88_09285 [Kordia sp.]|nr:MAG: hypothetical protein COA88_09285 [Kordia sp.]